MLDSLDFFLETTATPEYKRSLISACDVLSRVGIDDHLSEIEQVINADGDNRDTTFETIDRLIRDTIQQAIGQYGVEVTDQLDINCEILSMLAYQIDDFDDIDLLDTTLTMDLDAEESLAEIFSVVGMRAVEDYLTAIVSVSDTLIQRIDAILSAKIEAPSFDTLEVSMTISRFNKWLHAHAHDAKLFILDAMYNGARFTMPFDALVKDHLKAIGDLTAPAMKADQLLGFALVSNLKDEAIPKVVSHHLESMGVTPFDMSMAMRPVDLYFQERQKEQSA